MSTTLISNFSYNGKQPNFERDRVATVSDLLAVDPTNQKYDYGHIVFCKEDGKHYRFMYNYDSQNNTGYSDETGWFKEFATGEGGSIDTSNFATKEELNAKQDTITDLGTIRSGAAKGATAAQGVKIKKNPIAQPSDGIITLEIEYSDINNTPTFKTINGVSIIKSDDNDSGNIEITGGDGSVDLSGYVTKTELTDELKSKVDAEEGKGLSTEDFTTTLKNKLNGIASGAEVNVQSDWDATSGDAFIQNKPTFKTINGTSILGEGNIEITTEGGGITSESDPIFMASPAAGITADDIEAWNGKSDFSGSYEDLTDKPTIPSIDGLATTEQLNAKQDIISDLATIRENANNAFTGSINGSKNGGFFTIEKIVMNGKDYAREGSYTNIDLGTVITEHQDISGKLDKIEASSIYATKTALSDGLANKANITDIPDVVTEDTVSDWGFTKNTGDYIKPSGGIPQSDLADAVRNALDKAKNAFTGTVNYKSEGPIVAIDKIIMNGVEYTPQSSETHVDLGVVAPAYAEYTSTSTDVEVTTKYGYFPTTPEGLVEGVRVAVKFEGALSLIKTLDVNGTGAKNVYYKGSSLSSGAINQYNTYEFIFDGSYYRIIGVNTDTNTHYNAKNVVGASSSAEANAAATNGNVHLNLVENSTVRSSHSISGAGGVSVESDEAGNILITGTSAYALVNHGTSDTTFTLTPNTFHVWGLVSSLTLTFGSETEGVANEYLFQFSCSSSVATTLSLPSSVMWADGEAPTIEVMKTYQVSILNNCATIQSFG